MKKRLYALCFVIAMACGMQGTAMATTYSGEREIPVSAYHDDNMDIDPVEVKSDFSSWSKVRTTLESEYISPYITSVKDQSPYGTCWAFSFIAASESSLIREGLATLDGNQAIDLSELQLAYFLSHSVTDPLGGTKGDRFSLTNTSMNAFLQEGGNQRYATYRVANWYGLVNEAVAPYDAINNNEKVILSDELAYASDVFHLENAYWISMQDRNTVKRLIKEYGACATSYYTADAYYNTGMEGSWNQNEEVAVYCPSALETNHGITIVGWDDNYSADNFGTYKPQSDGAWYCKNSWGPAWSKNGYFWISYEDVPLLESEAFFYDFEKADYYDKNYQYDGGVLDASYPCSYSANIFTAEEDEYIKAVGFYTENSNYNCTVKVYKNCAVDSPTSGTLLADIHTNQLYAGFHTVELGDANLIKQGERFSVVVYQTAVDGSKVNVWVDTTYHPAGAWCSNDSSATKGQSFVSANGSSWQDASVDGNNCRIKAYTDVRVPVTNVLIDQTELSLYTEETAGLIADVYPLDASNTRVMWSTSDETVATIDEDGIITAHHAGKATITCTSLDDMSVQATCIVTVKQWVESLVIRTDDVRMAEGETQQFNATVLPEDATNQNLSWFSSDGDVVTISEFGEATAVGNGIATITCVATDRNQVTATCEVEVCERIRDIVIDANIELYPGETKQLEWSVIPDISQTKGVTWITNDADVVWVDDEGNITALKSGTATITCRSKDIGAVQAQCVVTVKQWVESVRLSMNSRHMMKGEQYQLNAIVLPVNASNQKLEWSSSNLSVATVSDMGEITALGYGTTTITCVAADQGTQYAICEVTVCEKMESISLNNTTLTLEEGKTFQLQATTQPAVDRTMGVYWISSNPSVVTVSSDGLVTAKATCENVAVSCIAKDGTGVKATCMVTVAKPIVVREKGTEFEDTITGAMFKVVTSGVEGATVELSKGNSCTDALVVPDNITIDGVTYTVTKIASDAFKGNKKLTRVMISDGITDIGKNAFSGCSNLKTVILGANVKSIGDNAFYNCKKLKTFTLGKNTKTIGNKAFYQCGNLKEILIPSKVTTIGKQAFYKCKALKKITIKTSKLTKKKVGNKAFKGIASKATIKVPKKKVKSYKSILKSRGIGSKVKVKKY